MSDLWDGLGADIQHSQGNNAWLYRTGTDTHGPIPLQSMGQKWVNGEINAQTPVARQGTDFAPLGQVAAFASFRQAAESAALAREKHTSRKQRTWALTLLMLVATGGTWLLRREYGHRLVQQQQEQLHAQSVSAAAALVQAQAQAQIQAEAEHQARLARASTQTMKLVALVSLGAMQDIKIVTTAPTHRPHKTHARQHKNGAQAHKQTASDTAVDSDDSFVASCQLTQQDIFATLHQELAKLNVCVEDEKHRDDANLLPAALALQFVVKADGKVTDFSIDDRHFRSGPLNNCLVKAFKTITFPATRGANCPVTIPIKISS